MSAAVVTGGTAGVGGATVREFARRGADVGILARVTDHNAMFWVSMHRDLIATVGAVCRSGRCDAPERPSSAAHCGGTWCRRRERDDGAPDPSGA
jgi:NAD(P)-dependent dehydrogenase (short-subunit alcohol dehydrogenase family)